MTAVWLRARSELRAGRRSLIALALLLGVMGGVVLTAAEGARRTDTAYGRFLDAIKQPDVFGLASPGTSVPVADFRKILKLPQVSYGVIVPALFGQAQSMDGKVLWGGDLNLNGTPSKALLRRFGFGAKLMAGRFPDPDRADEIAVGYRQHPDPRMQIGDTIRIAMVRPDIRNLSEVFSSNLPPGDLLPPVTVHIVGVVLGQGELQGSHDVFETPAFFQRYGVKSYHLPVMGALLRHGLADFTAFTQGVDRITQDVLIFSLGDEAAYVDRSTHLLAIALWLFAAIACVAGLLIFGQALARQTLEESVENPSLRALGMSGPQLFGVAMLRAGIVAVGGALVAMILAFACSPLTPFGRLARLAEPHPGFSFDAAILLGGTLILAILVCAFAALPAWRGTRLRGDALGAAKIEGPRPSAVADAFARAGLPPASVAGVRMALQPGRGRSSTPVRVTVFGAALSIAALVTAFTFGASFQHLFDTPRLYGHNWDLTAGNPFVPAETAAKIRAVLQADPNIRGIIAADIRDFVNVGPTSDPQRVNVLGFEPVEGSVQPTIVDGRAPASADEIALGEKTLRALNASVGDRIEVRKGDRSASMRIVGTAVLPSGFGPGLGVGAAMTLDGVHRVLPQAVANGFALRLAPGTNLSTEIRTLNRSLARYDANAQGPKEGEDLGNLRRVDNLPFVLAAVLGLAAAGTLAHTLVSSVRKRRRDLAILKTLGFVRRQVSATVAWQATTIGVLAVAVGVPVGIASGRWGWNVFADQLGVVPEPVTPVVVALLLIPATIAFAVLVAAIPARIAGRLRPAPVLRTE